MGFGISGTSPGLTGDVTPGVGIATPGDEAGALVCGLEVGCGVDDEVVLAGSSLVVEVEQPTTTPTDRAINVAIRCVR